MKVIICGAGQVGSNIARYLASEGNNVTVIDQSPELIQRIHDTLDVQAMVGHASHPDVLEAAGASEADLVIAVTHIDEINMISCQVASALFNVPTKIARVRAQSYLNPMWADLFSRENLPIDVIISPEIEVASPSSSPPTPARRRGRWTGSPWLPVKCAPSACCARKTARSFTRRCGN